MREDKRNPSKISQGWMAIVLLILAIIAVPAVALGTDLTLNATEPTAGVPLELPPRAPVRRVPLHRNSLRPKRPV
jgi:hypothetical protein